MSQIFVFESNIVTARKEPAARPKDATFQPNLDKAGPKEQRFECNCQTDLPLEQMFLKAFKQPNVCPTDAIPCPNLPSRT